MITLFSCKFDLILAKESYLRQLYSARTSNETYQFVLFIVVSHLDVAGLQVFGPLRN